MDDKEFVSFIAAKKLQQLGYRDVTHGVRIPKDAEVVSDTPIEIPVAPLIHLYHAAKWLREKYNIHIHIEAVMGKRWTYTLVDTTPQIDMYGDFYDNIFVREGYPIKDTYEAALSEGIDVALELITETK